MFERVIRLIQSLKSQGHKIDFAPPKPVMMPVTDVYRRSAPMMNGPSDARRKRIFMATGKHSEPGEPDLLGGAPLPSMSRLWWAKQKKGR